MRRLLIGAALLVAALAVAALLIWQSMQRYLQAPMAIDGDYALTIDRGATLGQVVDRLVADGVTDAGYWLLLEARRSATASRIKAGDYTLRAGMTPTDALRMFVAGDVDLERLTVIEGWTAAQAIALTISHPAIDNDLPAVPGKRADGSDWLDANGHAALAGLLGITEPNIEGWLFPDTYQFARGTRASALLRQMHAQMSLRLERAWQTQGPDSVLDTPYEALILASIVEKETGRDDERARIAGVFERRLARAMRLQTDPTVIYGIGADYDGDIRRRDLQADTPYNTYRIDGLPPTPIALPGEASLRAVMDPADGDALFFVATGDADGSHHFSSTLDEHNAAVARYLRKLRGR